MRFSTVRIPIALLHRPDVLQSPFPPSSIGLAHRPSEVKLSAFESLGTSWSCPPLAPNATT